MACEPALLLWPVLQRQPCRCVPEGLFCYPATLPRGAAGLAADCGPERRCGADAVPHLAVTASRRCFAGKEGEKWVVDQL